MAQITNKRFTLLNNSGTAILRLGYDASNFVDFIPDSSGNLGLTAKKYLIGDTANANMTVGLTINQGANDDEAFALKSSDVAHGVTGIAETDSYFTVQKFSATDGGVSMTGFSEGSVAARVIGVATTENTTKTTAGLGNITLRAATKSGTGATAPGGNANLLVIQADSTTRFIFDADGDSHQDVGTAWTNFDDHEDTALLTALSVGVSRTDDPIREGFGHFLEQHRETLEQTGLVTFNEDGHHFVNWSRTNMLVIGAVRQLADRLDRMERLLPRPA